MGIHWCGWCGGMSSGGMCDELNHNCQKEFTKLYKEIRNLLPKNRQKDLDKLLSAEANTY